MAEATMAEVSKEALGAGISNLVLPEGINHPVPGEVLGHLTPVHPQAALLHQRRPLRDRAEQDAPGFSASSRFASARKPIRSRTGFGRTIRPALSILRVTPLIMAGTI
jgi:hypothetical protein